MKDKQEHWMNVNILSAATHSLYTSHMRLTILLTASLVMLCASSVPWLADPLGGADIPWTIPVLTGWNPPFWPLNYGTLCVIAALSLLLYSFSYIKIETLEESSASACRDLPLSFRWLGETIRKSLKRKSIFAGLLCAPLLLWYWQFLFVDLSTVAKLASHKQQALLIQQHFGYSLAAPLIEMKPFDITTTTISARAVLILCQLSWGAFLPPVSVLLAWIGTNRIYRGHQLAATAEKDINTQHKQSNSATATYKLSRAYVLPMVMVTIIIVLFFGRSFLSTICDYKARELLAEGEYGMAGKWLDVAGVLNPSLYDTAFYHRGRGQILYFLNPASIDDDVRLYLAAVNRQQGDYLGAHLQLQSIRQRQALWWIEDMNTTLVYLAEFQRPLRGLSVKRAESDVTALPWLQTLASVDKDNIYAHYMIARLQCKMLQYQLCQNEMHFVLAGSSDDVIRSNAYTYIALSIRGQGDDFLARQLLFKALELDPTFRNNTAREALSGLH